MIDHFIDENYIRFIMNTNLRTILVKCDDTSIFITLQKSGSKRMEEHSLLYRQITDTDNVNNEVTHDNHDVINQNAIQSS